MKILSFLLILFTFLILANSVYALDCSPTGADKDRIECKFGTINPPPALQDFLKNDQTGAGAISHFLSNLVALFFTLATVVAVFMFLWAAFEWMTSGGEKEKVASARNKIIYAIIGIVLFATAFAAIRLLGTFTGFTFFEGQNYTVLRRDSQGNITGIECRNGKGVYTSIIKDPEAECQ